MKMHHAPHRAQQRAPFLAAAGLVAGLTLAADAATVTQAFDFPQRTLIDGATTDTTVAATVRASFDKFDASQGELTAASFAYDYRFNITTTIGPNGGMVSGSANGPFEINDQIRGGSGNGGNVRGSPNTFAVVPFPISGTLNVPAGDLPGLIATGPGQSNTFDYEVAANLIFDPQAGATASSNLSDASSVTVTYTFTPAVPEPASLAVLGLGATGLLRRRRA